MLCLFLEDEVSEHMFREFSKDFSMLVKMGFC